MGAALAPLDATRSAGLVIVFSLFIAACAQFSIQIGPVPITGQSFAVLLTGALLGSRLGAAAVIAYLIEGALGLPSLRVAAPESCGSLVRPAVTWLRFRPRRS
jgi:biotin transport system substrate-specific component